MSVEVPNYGGLASPVGLQFVEWAAVAVEQLSSYGLPSASSDLEWQAWATNFSNGTLPGSQVPDPYGFSTWQDWAHALIGTLA
jgi:hypothetical protein